MKKLITIMTPCYNVEKYIERYLISVLNQTYDNIQLILINDGSTDKTEEIINSYKEDIIKRNIDFTYLYQENKGQDDAIRNGIKYVKGEYLVWPDSDDFFENDAIENMARFLDDNSKYSIVRTKMNIRDEKNIEKILEVFEYSSENKYKEDVFEDYILENNVFYCGGRNDDEI